LHALVAALPVNLEAAAEFDLTVLERAGFAVVPLHSAHSDAWTERLNLEPRVSQSAVMLDLPVTRALARAIGCERYALLETDYFGGVGTQRAALFEDDAPILESDSINAVLARLRVARAVDKDEFDTLELGALRSTEPFFEAYLV
jgi:hypothetical protein